MPTDKTEPLPIGTILDGKFRVTREVGRGGMAAVFEAENIDIGKRVAVKVLAAELVTSRVVTERFLREARASAKVRSPYICDVYDVGTFEDRPFLVMELLEGESLYDRLSRVRRLDVDTTLRVAKQTARGLTKAHEAHIVHRDLKPENIFLTKNEEGELVAKIVDFGLAKFYEPHNEGGRAARLTKEGALFGTPAYMSPEQARAQGEVDHRTDLWALACIVYECLTGRTVWNVEQGVAMILAQIAGAPIPRPSRIRDDLPSTFDDWFVRAMSRDMEGRFQTAREFSDTLQVALKPPAGSVKEAPLNTAEEGEDIDKLVSVDLSSAPGVSATAPRPAAAPAVAPSDVAVPLPSTLPPAARARGPGFAIFVLLLVTALVGGGYAVWFYVLHPPDRRIASGSPLSFEDGAGRRADELDPVETEPFALQLASGQLRLTKGQEGAATKLFKDAFDSSKSNAARSFMAHAEVSEENTGGRCHVTGLGRPRPFAGSDEPSSLPILSLTEAGVVVTWAETVPQTRRRQAFSALLDSALRRVGPVVNVAPEGAMVQEPTLWHAGDSLSLLYWESGTDEPGIYARLLDSAGRIVAAPRQVSTSSQKQSYPTLSNAADGSVWIVWSERTSARVQDLFARKLDAKLTPAGPPIQLTAYSPPRASSSTASKAAAVIAHDQLNIAFALERNQEHHVFQLRVGLSELAQGSGVEGEQTVPASGQERPDRFLGQVIPISSGGGKHNHPDLACVEEGCFTVWDNESAGAQAAFVSGATGEVVWRREIGPKGLRPSIAASQNEVAVAWYENNRLKLARLTKDRLEEPSVLARASGYQPSPGIVAGEKPGQWYLSWRDFEAARHEAFVLRADCN